MSLGEAVSSKLATVCVDFWKLGSIEELA